MAKVKEVKAAAGGEKSKGRSKAKLSRTSKPADMTLEGWQAQLRREYGREQKFRFENLGTHPVFTEFRVTNPESGSVNRVTIRGAGTGDNACTCRDFATNALGTCKHIEFTLAKLERFPKTREMLEKGPRVVRPQVRLRYGARRQVVFVPGEAGVELRRLAAGYFDAQGCLKAEAFDRFEQFVKEAGKLEGEVKCEADALAFIAEVRDAAARVKRIDTAFPGGIDDAKFKSLVKVDLYPYQREGALFAAKAGRCLIGDEMGLGKTIQAIAGAEIMAQCLGVERVLVVSPTSLKHQWEREIEKFIGRRATVINGQRAARAELFKEPGFFKITNYDTLAADLDLIMKWAPDLVILDEAQRIKNWKTRAAKTVKRINSPYAIVLTGTPLENRLEELVSIVEFVDAHRLGPSYKFLADHQIVDEKGKVVGYKNLDAIGRTLAPVLIRRQKSQVLTQLPARLDKNFFVPMSPGQRRLHSEYQEVVAVVVAKWRRMGFLTEADQRKLMVGLQSMRMSCDSSYLLDGKSDDGVKPDELVQLLDEVLETPGAKVVVFSQWLRMHELIARRLTQRKVGHVVFHGGVPGIKRKELVDRFREEADCRVFLSTDAGGVGLNLQFASVVVNMDLPWNPAVLEQRIGRVHRMGQKNPVRVVNFVSEGTIEEGMLSVLKFKKSLFTGALDGGETEVFFGGSKLKRFMETVERATTNIPDAPPEEPLSLPEDLDLDLDLPELKTAGPSGEGTGSPAAAAAQASAPAQETWGELLEAGLSMLSGAGSDGPLVRQDAQGKAYLHVPMPKPETLQQLMALAGQLLAAMKKP